MANVQNGSCFDEEIIVLSSSDEEESRPERQSNLSEISKSYSQQINQDNCSTENNIFPKIISSYSLEEQEKLLQSRITWKDIPASCESQPADKISDSAESVSKIESHSSSMSNGVGPESSELVDKSSKGNAIDSKVTSSTKSLPTKLKNSGSNNVKAQSEDAMSSFLTVCRTFVDDEDGLKIIQSANKHYLSADTNFVHSKQFCDFINKKSKDVVKDSCNMFLHIKDVIDELKPYKHKKRLLKNVVANSASPMNDLVANNVTDILNENDLCRTSANSDSNHHHDNSVCTTVPSILSKKQPTEKQIKRLECLLQKIDKKIKHLQKKELSLDSMNDSESIYIQEDRFKKKFMKVWNKLCSITERSPETGREIEKKFRFNGSRYPEINEKVSKFVNKRKIFPDYSDILNLVSSVNPTLKLSDMQLHALARETFEEVGKELQLRRFKDNRELIGCFLTDNIDLSDDPAEHNEELKTALRESSKKASNDLDEIIDKYVQKQIELKLEPEAVQDNDDKSDHSSEEQEENEDEEDQESEKSDIDFIERTVVSDDENDIGTTKDDHEKERNRVCHSIDEKSPSSAPQNILENCTEENSASSSSSNSSLSQQQLLPFLDLPSTSTSISSLPSKFSSSKRHQKCEFITLQAKIPCLENRNNYLGNYKNTEILQKEFQPQTDDDIIVLE